MYSTGCISSSACTCISSPVSYTADVIHLVVRSECSGQLHTCTKFNIQTHQPQHYRICLGIICTLYKPTSIQHKIQHSNYKIQLLKNMIQTSSSPVVEVFVASRVYFDVAAVLLGGGGSFPTWQHLYEVITYFRETGSDTQGTEEVEEDSHR